MRCAFEEEIPQIIQYFYSSAYGGHFGVDRTAAKVLHVGYL